MSTFSCSPDLISLELTETDAWRKAKAQFDRIPHVVKFLIVTLSVLSFRAYLDYFGLTMYLLAFGLGAVWMLTTSLLLLCLYLYLTQEAKCVISQIVRNFLIKLAQGG